MQRTAISIAIVLAGVALTSRADAHCDTTRGPVVSDARDALAAGEVTRVLHWVRPNDEAEVKRAFDQTLAVRKLGANARALADRYFFESLVRIHRASEGAPFTGLKQTPAEPLIAATDAALKSGTPTDVETVLTASIRKGLSRRFHRAHAARGFATGDVAAGRRYVAAYVGLTHWVENVAAAAHGEHKEHGARSENHGAQPAHREHSPLNVAETMSHHNASSLPWLLVVLLGLLALFEAGLLLRNRGRTRNMPWPTSSF